MRKLKSPKVSPFSKKTKKEECWLKSQITGIAVLVKEQINTKPNTPWILFHKKEIYIKRFLSQNGRLGVTNVLVGSETNGRVFYVLYREEKVLSVLDSSFKQIMFSLEKEQAKKIMTNKLYSESLDEESLAVEEQGTPFPLTFLMGGSPHDSSTIPQEEKVSLGCSFNFRRIKKDDGRW